MPVDVHRVRAICFDVDGTLSDTDDQFVLHLSRWLNLISFLIPGGDNLAFAQKLVMLAESPSNGLLTLLDRLGLDAAIAAVTQRLRHLLPGERYALSLLIPGVKEMLQSLSAHYVLAIVSARGEQSTLDFLDRFDLKSYFHTIVTAQTCRFTKPYPDPILYAAAQMGVSASVCLMVGDTVPDILAGKRAGAQTVGVLCGFGQETELRRAGADLILPQTSLLAQVLLADKG